MLSRLRFLSNLLTSADIVGDGEFISRTLLVRKLIVHKNLRLDDLFVHAIYDGLLWNVTQLTIAITAMK